MTTIVVTDHSVACDAMTQADGVIILTKMPKVIEMCGRLFGIAGDTAMLQPVASWVVAGASIDSHPKGDWTVVEVYMGPSHLVQYWTSGTPYPVVVETPFAMGSGERFAYGALDVGATAEEAVKAAIKRDPNSSGPVKVFSRLHELAAAE